MVKINFISFKDAITEAEPIIDKKNGTWWGKKVYLGYSNKKGWKVHELNLFARFLRYFKLAYKDTHFKKIVTQLDGLNKQEASIISKNLCARMPALSEKMQEIYRQNIQSINTEMIREKPVPLTQIPREKKSAANTPDIHLKRLIPKKKSIKKKKLNDKEKTAQTAEKDLTREKNPASNPEPNLRTNSETKPERQRPAPPEQPQPSDKLPENPNQSVNQPAEKEIASVRSDFVLPDKISSAIHPLGLSYIGNSCYMDSVMEMMLSQDCIRQKILQASRDIIKEKKSVAQELLEKDIPLKKLQTLKRKRFSVKKKEALLHRLIELIEASSQGETAIPGHALRQAIFESGLHPYFHQKNSQNIYKQHDAADLLLLFMSDLLNCSFQTKSIDTIKGGKTFERAPEANFTVISSLKDGENVFEDIIKDHFKERPSDERRKFTIDGKEENLHYITRPQILTMPDIMGIQFKRFAFGAKGKKKEDPVILPKEGIVDFSPYYGGKTPDSCKYEIAGYVVHLPGGTMSNGHYVSYVKIGNQYFYCNDLSSYSEISKEEFYGNKDSYMILLKKMPPESVKLNALETKGKLIASTEPLQNGSDSGKQSVSEPEKPLFSVTQSGKPNSLKSEKQVEPKTEIWGLNMSDFFLNPSFF